MSAVCAAGGGRRCSHRRLRRALQPRAAAHTPGQAAAPLACIGRPSELKTRSWSESRSAAAWGGWPAAHLEEGSSSTEGEVEVRRRARQPPPLHAARARRGCQLRRVTPIRCRPRARQPCRPGAPALHGPEYDAYKNQSPQDGQPELPGKGVHEHPQPAAAGGGQRHDGEPASARGARSSGTRAGQAAGPRLARAPAARGTHAGGGAGGALAAPRSGRAARPQPGAHLYVFQV